MQVPDKQASTNAGEGAVKAWSFLVLSHRQMNKWMSECTAEVIRTGWRVEDFTTARSSEAIIIDQSQDREFSEWELSGTLERTVFLNEDIRSHNAVRTKNILSFLSLVHLGPSNHAFRSEDSHWNLERLCREGRGCLEKPTLKWEVQC